MSLEQDERDARVAWQLHLRDLYKWPPSPAPQPQQPPREIAQPTPKEPS